MIYFADGFLENKAHVASKRRAKAQRFFSLSLQLPSELKMLLCNRVVGSGATIVKMAHSERGFWKFAQENDSDDDDSDFDDSDDDFDDDSDDYSDSDDDDDDEDAEEDVEYDYNEDDEDDDDEDNGDEDADDKEGSIEADEVIDFSSSLRKDDF